MCVKYVCQQCVGFPSFALPPSLSLSLSNPLCSTHLWRSTWWIAEPTPTLCAASLSSPSSASLSSQMLYRYEDGTSLANRWRMVANTRVCVCVWDLYCVRVRAQIEWPVDRSQSHARTSRTSCTRETEPSKSHSEWVSFSLCVLLFFI